MPSRSRHSRNHNSHSNRSSNKNRNRRDTHSQNSNHCSKSESKSNATANAKKHSSTDKSCKDEEKSCLLYQEESKCNTSGDIINEFEEEILYELSNDSSSVYELSALLEQYVHRRNASALFLSRIICDWVSPEYNTAPNKLNNNLLLHSETCDRIRNSFLKVLFSLTDVVTFKKVINQIAWSLSIIKILSSGLPTLCSSLMHWLAQHVESSHLSSNNLQRDELRFIVMFLRPEIVEQCAELVQFNASIFEGVFRELIDALSDRYQPFRIWLFARLCSKRRKLIEAQLAKFICFGDDNVSRKKTQKKKKKTQPKQTNDTKRRCKSWIVNMDEEEEEEEEDDEDRITFRRSLSADPRTIPHNEASKKKVKPRTVRVNKKEKEIVYKKEREKHDKFRIGDVVMVSLGKQEDLARIRFYGSTVLDANCAMFGIECFCVEFGSHVVNGCRVLDGSINGGDAVFCVKKAGYGTFIGLERIKSRKCLWNLKQSKNALKLTEFDCDVLVAAAKYGSLKVIKHLLRILLKKNSSARSRSRTRSNSYSSNAQYDKGEIQAIQTGFGYAVLHNHTKIVKMILTHFGSNNTSFNTIINNTKKKKKKTKSMTDFMIQRDLRPRTSSHTSGSSVGSDYDDEYVDEEVDDQTVNNSKLNTSRFYTSDLFDLVCERQNLSMLQILIEYDSWPLLSPSSRGLYRIFGSAGYLKWIKYLLEISPYIINMPLVSSDIHSTMMCTAMRHNRFEYTQYILSAFGTKLQQLQMDIPWPLLLVSIMNLNANTVHLPQAIDIQSQLLLHAPHQVNWCPAHCLREANQWLDIFDLIEVQYCDHQLTYYNGVVLGSILAAICHKSVTIYRTMKLSDEKQILHCLSDMLSTAMLYGIDFNQHNEFQHVWMTYDANKYRWNISNFPYNVCHTKQEFIFLQKMFKKALKKYPIKLLNTCCPFIDHQLIQIFKKIIIPYASYDALIFESLHWTKPINDTDQDLSEPESVEFMFAYQRSPVVE
eukprot:724891_1